MNKYVLKSTYPIGIIIINNGTRKGPWYFI